MGCSYGRFTGSIALKEDTDFQGLGGYMTKPADTRDNSNKAMYDRLFVTILYKRNAKFKCSL